MIEKLPSVRKIYKLDDEKWNNEEDVSQIYQDTQYGYPMINLGKIIMVAGVVCCAFSGFQVSKDPLYLFQTLAGGIIFASGVGFINISEEQMQNYVYRLEAESRLRKF